jgi:hypothetical protein
LDGAYWTEIDRQTDNTDLAEFANAASFAVSNAAECRFIRLTHTDKQNNWLTLCAFEVFGILLE